MAEDSMEAPLLLPQKHEWQESCPGCKLDRKKREGKGPPKKELAYVGILVLCNSLPISSLFPFLYFMVRDLHIAKSVTDIGFYAGAIGSSFMFGRFLSSTFWGMIADKYGRKPVFLIGSTSIIILNTIFGCSVNFWMAIISRFLLGSFNGMFGPIRAYASEICREEHQALGLSMVGTFWGVGLVIGPALGGYLAQPSNKYPQLFPVGSFFDRFPYALPCFCISAFAGVALVLTFWLPESLHTHPILKRKVVSEGDDNMVVDIASRQNDALKPQVSEQKHKIIIPKGNHIWGKDSIFRNRGLLGGICVNCTWALHDMAYTEIFSLWAVSPSKYGGLDFTTSDVGVVLAATGASLLVFQLAFFPPIVRAFGAIQTIRMMALLSIPLLELYPLIGRLHGPSVWGILITVSIIKNVLSSCCSTGSFLLINNSVTMDQRGAANGFSLSLQSLFKAIGPASAGALFSWSEKRINAKFLPGIWMVFTILNIFALITVLVSFKPILPEYLNKPKPETPEDEHILRRSSFTF